MSTTKSHDNDSKQGVMRSTSIISLGTLMSRVLGFIRDIILAHLLGTAVRADAFFVAFRIPNLFRDIVGEGAVNSTVVPVLSEYREKNDKEELWSLINVVLVSSLILLSCLTILGVVFAPVIIRIIAPGFMIHADELALTVRLTRIMFPYLVFIGLTAYSVGILYTHRSFVAPAFSPCLLNIAIIVSALISSRMLDEPVVGLAIGVLVGGAAQLMLQMVALKKNKIPFKKPKTLNHPGARKIGALLIPRLFGSAIYQLNVLVDTFCASMSFIVGAGGISAIYYANRIIQFPMGVFGIALASAILPTLSGFAARDEIDDFRKMLVFSLKNIFFLMLPVSLLLLFFSTQVIRVLFERGEFNAYSTSITSWALFCYAFGLISFGGIKIMVTAFHARQDTATPARVAGVSLALNAALNFLLMGPLKIGGIALASSIAATVNFITLFIIMDRRIGAVISEVIWYFLKICVATVAMGITLGWCSTYVHVSSEVLYLCIASSAGICVFLGICTLLNVSQTRYLIRWISGKR